MPRHAAFLCLRSGSPTPLRDVDRFAARRGLDERDTALARRLVGTEIRRRGTLRAVVTAFAHQKPKAELATLLRLGICQLLFLDRVPDHAAVSETVRTTADHLGLAKGRTANGVLRNVQRALQPGHANDPTRDVVGTDLRFEFPVFRDMSEHPHLWAEDALSIPSALHKRWSKRVGVDEANRLALLALDEAPLSIRVTRSAESRDAARATLESLAIPITPGGHGAILLAPPDAAPAVLRTDLFGAGAITIQGEHALRAAELLGDVDGADVLDLCAAPGGKAAVLRERGARRLVAADLSPRRITNVRGGFDRLGLEPPELVAMDRVLALREGATFDAVLIDAPCSNTGVLAQRPAARWRYGPKSQAELAALQNSLLDDAASVVRPGGALVHSTCSLEPEENEQVVRRFLEGHPGWEVEAEIRSAPASLEEGGPVDGGYAARLRAPLIG